MRKANVKRQTNETKINLSLNLDGKGVADISTGCGFLDHMLTLLTAHAQFDIKLRCVGDTFVDYHHTVEDVGIVFGQALKTALGDKKGINRYGDKTIVMDEALVLTAIDLSGRSSLCYDLEVPAIKVGDFDTELVEEFFASFVRNAECGLHVKKLNGKNTHHIIECAFKSFARTLKEAVTIDKNSNLVPSTKGVL